MVDDVITFDVAWYFSLVIAGVLGVAITTVANLATTVYLHRGLSHRALTFSRPARGSFRIVLWLTTGIRPRQWVAVHRKHHAHTDTAEDPHSPVIHGWWKVQVRNYAMYRRAARDVTNTERFAKDLPADRLDKMLFDRALLGLGTGIGILVLLFGPLVAMVAAVVHLNYYIAANSAVNAIGHHFGRRPYDNSATNLQWLAFLTAGEGFHNNHHAAPTSAKLAHRWYEIDLGWFLIKPMTWLRLARVRLDGLKLVSGSQPSTSPT
ncbi:MAG: fatty acid desaturase [Actinomycetota bacterium]|nr:fatty acid desaturase [Actinomycetota bacterium]